MPTFKTTPKLSDHSEDVKKLQTFLKNNGFDPGEIDGIFGPVTERALKNFQHSRDLSPDGIIGNKTLAALGFTLERSVRDDGFTKLSWEHKVPESSTWSTFVFEKIESLFEKFSLCEDILVFRPDYNSLSQQQKINVWGELISAICLHESSWKPWSTMVETKMGIDPVTGKQVRSEGLMQLSYQDQKTYSMLPCRFDWLADKHKAIEDKTRTILDPIINLEFGIEILARQIERRKKIALDRNQGVYWAVLRYGHQSLPKIIKMVQTINP